jgi:tRNA uridine 5-carboxymethylaminomethyl modification enzyme
LSAKLGVDLGDSITLAQLGKRAGVGVEAIRMVLPGDIAEGLTDTELESGLADVVYEGYIEAQRATLKRLNQHDAVKINPDFDYRGLSGLSHEMVERFERGRPRTFGEARKIPGLTPAALATLLVNLSVQRQAA